MKQAAAFPARCLQNNPPSEHLFLELFAFLVANGARGLASRLAGSLALTATTLLHTFLQISGRQSSDSLSFSLFSFAIINKHPQKTQLSIA